MYYGESFSSFLFCWRVGVGMGMGVDGWGIKISSMYEKCRKKSNMGGKNHYQQQWKCQLLERLAAPQTKILLPASCTEKEAHNLVFSVCTLCKFVTL